MIRAARSEWLKLRRPGMILGGVGGITVFSVLAILLGMRELTRQREGASVALYSQVDGFTQVMRHASAFLGIIALGIAAFAFATEFSTGTLRNLLVRQPHRVTLLAGKSLAVGSLLAIAVLIASAVSFPVALQTAPHYGVDTSLWTSSAGVGHLVGGAGNLVLSTLGYGLIGALLGVLMRSPAPAIVIGIAYVFAVEGLLTNAFTSLANILFASQLGAIANGGTPDVGYGTALVVAGVWAAGAAVIAAVVFRRRDVAA